MRGSPTCLSTVFGIFPLYHVASLVRLNVRAAENLWKHLNLSKGLETVPGVLRNFHKSEFIQLYNAFTSEMRKLIGLGGKAVCPRPHSWFVSEMRLDLNILFPSPGLLSFHQQSASRSISCKAVSIMVYPLIYSLQVIDQDQLL